jgi:hypothetical protein
MISTGMNQPDRRSVTDVKASPSGYEDALRVVLTWTVVDAFALTTLETVWFSRQVTKIISDANKNNKFPTMVPLAVRQELFDRAYSRFLSDWEAQDSDPAVFAKGALGQTVEALPTEWADALSDVIETVYPTTPVEAVGRSAALSNTLTLIGVGGPRPRAARYLPNVLRVLVNQRP